MSKRILWMLPLAGAALFAVSGATSSDGGLTVADVATANTRSAGFAPAHKLSQGLAQVPLAQGSTRLENPSGIVTYYGYESDTVNERGEPVMVPTGAALPTEAQKTEPDKNTYLVFERGLGGADPSFRYGTHFLFQGHEAAARVAGAQQGYVTRINLDADTAHRVTLLATRDSSGKALPVFDGSTWDPSARRLLFTWEGNGATTGGVWQATLDVPARADDLTGSLGRGGYEGIQNDSAGNVWLVEDIGGANKTGAAPARRPNSFVFRFVPADPADLTRGKLQALQVLAADGHAITFETQAAPNAPDQVALHSYGNSLRTRWVTVHDTSVDGTAPFDANAAAKSASATPFKRPENGVFRPGTSFREFFFTETGDTNATSPENDTAGGWGAIQKLTQPSPTSDTGTLTLFFRSDGPHSSFDNIAFLTRDLVSPVQDMGDTLHGQLNALDSGFVLDATVDYSNPSNPPVRWLAEGRDPSATIDAANAGFGKNDQDNEITGIHVSDGDPTVRGILGAQVPRALHDGWRWFWTQQHGDNVTWEVVRAGAGEEDDDD